MPIPVCPARTRTPVEIDDARIGVTAQEFIYRLAAVPPEHGFRLTGAGAGDDTRVDLTITALDDRATALIGRRDPSRGRGCLGDPDELELDVEVRIAATDGTAPPVVFTGLARFAPGSWIRIHAERDGAQLPVVTQPAAGEGPPAIGRASIDLAISEHFDVEGYIELRPDAADSVRAATFGDPPPR